MMNILLNWNPFLVASLLSCLHQLKIENSRLEDHINGLISRRDHLLAVNARLAIPLGQQTATSQGEFPKFLRLPSTHTELPATHLNNGPLEATPAPQQPPPQQHQQPPAVNIQSKRSTALNPNNTTHTMPIENGVDYRGHHPMNSQHQTGQPSTSSHIRFILD